MKKLKITLMCAAVSFAFSQSGICAYLVGSVDPGSPASVDEEIGYVETLLAMGANEVLLKPINKKSNRTFTTFGWNAAYVDVLSGLKFDTSKATPFTGYQFVLGKFGNTSYVWELDSGKTFKMFAKEGDFLKLPPTKNGKQDLGQGLSHYTVFNGTAKQVPDGGTSIALLGMALLGLGGVRKLIGKP